MKTSSGPFEQLAERLYEGDAPGVERLIGEALEQGTGAAAILGKGLIAGMDRVGRDFQSGELFVPELIVAARAMHAGLDLLRPGLARQGERSLGTAVLGTVKGDLHDIGKRLVGIMMEGQGLRVVDLGHDVAPERFVEAAREEGAELVGMSALLSTTMPMMRTTLEALRQADLGVLTLVGGAPVTQRWADEIGADGYAPDAVAAAARARELLQR
jgi:5-methyltetrahydrofolate--homocysteine methyltransferase